MNNPHGHHSGGIALVWRFGAAALALLLLRTVGAGTAAMASHDAIRAAAEQTVREAAPAPAQQVEVLPLDQRLQLVACERPLDSYISGDGTVRERTSVAVRCTAPVRWTVYVVVKTSTDAEVLVSRQPLARGAAVMPDDVIAEQRKLPGVAQRYITDVTRLPGLQLRRPLPAGVVLEQADFEPIPLVKRGQLVTLLAQVGGIEVRSSGVALADAGREQRVRVRNSVSRVEVEGLVRGRALVEVPL